MYTLACTAVLLLTLIGADYSRNLSCYKSEKLLHIKPIKIKEKSELSHYLKPV